MQPGDQLRGVVIGIAFGPLPEEIDRVEWDIDLAPPKTQRESRGVGIEVYEPQTMRRRVFWFRALEDVEVEDPYKNVGMIFVRSLPQTRDELVKLRDHLNQMIDALPAD